MVQDGGQVTHCLNYDYKNIEYYINDISEHNTFSMFKHYTKQLFEAWHFFPRVTNVELSNTLTLIPMKIKILQLLNAIFITL